MEKRTEYFKKYMVEYWKTHKEERKKINANYFIKRKIKNILEGTEKPKKEMNYRLIEEMFKRTATEPEQRRKILTFFINGTELSGTFESQKEKKERITEIYNRILGNRRSFE